MKSMGALLGTMSGSLGGITASRNRGGQYFRQRVVPTNPASTRQNAVRGFMATAVAAWSNTLTAAERQAWKVYADNTPRTNTLGQELILTGQQAYIASNVIRMQHGSATVTAAPTEFNRGEPVAVVETTINNVANNIGIGTDLSTSVLLDSPAPDSGVVVMFLGRPVGAGINFWSGPYQLATSNSFAAAATQVDLSSTFALMQQDDPLVIGQRRPVRFVVMYDDGRVSSDFRAIVPVIEDVI